MENMLPGALVVIGGLVAPLARQTQGCPHTNFKFIEYFPHCLVVVTVARGVAGPIAVVPELSAVKLVAASKELLFRLALFLNTCWPIADLFGLRCAKSQFFGDDLTLFFRENRVFCA